MLCALSNYLNMKKFSKTPNRVIEQMPPYIYHLPEFMLDSGLKKGGDPDERCFRTDACYAIARGWRWTKMADRLRHGFEGSPTVGEAAVDFDAQSFKNHSRVSGK